MAPEQRTELAQALEASRQDFVAAVAGLSEHHARMNPEAGRWSVLECVEHVTVVEGYFLERLEQGERLAEPRIDKQKEAELAARVPNRTTKVQAPEMVRPTGRFSSLAEALDQFNAVRSRTMKFSEERAGELYSIEAPHPRFGNMNGVELMVLIAGHSRRHAHQIREVRTAIGC